MREVNKHLKPDFNKAHIAVSNHVSATDPIVYLSLGYSSFVAKDETKKMFGFGISSWAMQGVLVSRDKKDSTQ